MRQRSRTLTASFSGTNLMKMPTFKIRPSQSQIKRDSIFHTNICNYHEVGQEPQECKPKRAPAEKPTAVTSYVTATYTTAQRAAELLARVQLEGADGLKIINKARKLMSEKSNCWVKRLSQRFQISLPGDVFLSVKIESKKSFSGAAVAEWSTATHYSFFFFFVTS